MSLPGDSPKAAAEDDWEGHWGRFAASAERNPAQDLRHRAMLRALRRARTPIAHLLDVGSGQGDFLVKAVSARAAASYVGFELSRTGVAISRAKVPAARFFEVDLFEPSAESQEFLGWASAAVCSDVIEHVDDPVTFLRSLRRFMKSDALLVLTVPGGPMSKFDRHIGHRRHYDAESVRDVLSQGGFTVDEVQLAGFPFFNLYRLLVILRGDRLVRDVESSDGVGTLSLAASMAMRIFSVLFAFNLQSSPWGWQVVALARNGIA